MTPRIPSRGHYSANKVSRLNQTKTLLRPIVDSPRELSTEISIGYQVLIGFNGISHKKGLIVLKQKIESIREFDSYTQKAALV